MARWIHRSSATPAVSEQDRVDDAAYRIVVIAFNDAALSLVDIKQQKQGRASRSVA